MIMEDRCFIVLDGFALVFATYDPDSVVLVPRTSVAGSSWTLSSLSCDRDVVGWLVYYTMLPCTSSTTVPFGL